jgi:hypothetical protein
MRHQTLSIVTGLVAAALVAPAAYAFSHSFTVKRGKHEATGPAVFSVKKPKIGKRQDRTLRFQAYFTASALYRSQNPHNQHDFNKLLGISSARIHHNSIRLGWRARPDQRVISLGFYGYAAGRRIMEELTTVPINQWVDVELRMHSNGMHAVAGGRRHEFNGSLGFHGLTSTWLLRTMYFGGDEKAPQDITVNVRNVNLR